MNNLDLFAIDEQLLFGSAVDKHLLPLIETLSRLSIDERISALNRVKEALHDVSPMRSEPVDLVRWVRSDDVYSNSWNPNKVAPPEMALLEHSITADGYTQPVVGWPQADGTHEVVDGFHRHRVGKESATVRKRVHGYLPIVAINTERADKGDRMAATIRHNRARGKHQVEHMSEIVVELKRRFWSDEKIARELGMEPDEVLRLTQITGLSTLFADRAFSEAWEAESFTGEIEAESIDDDEDQANIPPLETDGGIRQRDVGDASTGAEAVQGECIGSADD